MIPRISAFLLLSAFVIPLVGCSPESPSPSNNTPTANQTSPVVSGEVATKPGAKPVKKPKDLKKSLGSPAVQLRD